MSFSLFECCLPQQEYCVCVCGYVSVDMCACVCVRKRAASDPNWPRLASLRCWHVFDREGGEGGCQVEEESWVARWAGLMPTYNYAHTHTHTEAHTLRQAEMRATKDTLVALCKRLACSIATRCLLLSSSPPLYPLVPLSPPLLSWT